jgi:hypothetical protein
MSRNLSAQLQATTSSPTPEATPRVKGKPLDREKQELIARVNQCLISDGNPRLAAEFGAAFTITDSSSGWADKDGVVISVQEFRPTLEAGVYSTGITNNGQPFLIKETPVTDELMVLPSGRMPDLMDEFSRFWKLEPVFEANGFLHKRGLFLVGPPGAGKSSTIQLLSKTLVEDFDGIVLYLENPNVGYSCLRMIRSIEPNRKIVCVLEDFDSLIKNYEEADFLSLFDGEKSVDHIVYIATTNYPEQIDRRFLDRPSRFDQVVTIRLPSLEDRLFYLKAKAPNVPLETLEMWAKETKDLAIAHLKEIIVSVTCFEYTFEDTMKRLREQKKLMNSEKMVGKKGVGFEG